MHAAHLRRDGAQQPHLVAREAAAPQRLHDQHAERRAALDDRHAEERVVALLAGLREELVARVGERIDDHHRLELLDHHAGQAFADRHRHLADGAALETGGRPQREPLGPRIEQVDRADVGARALGDHLDDPLQRLLEVLGARGGRGDVLEDGEAVAALAGLRRVRRAPGARACGSRPPSAARS